MKHDHIAMSIGALGTKIAASEQTKLMEEGGLGAVIEGVDRVSFHVAEVFLNIGLRRPEWAREIIQRIEDSKVNHNHPIDDFCISSEVLDKAIQRINEATDKANAECDEEHV